MQSVFLPFRHILSSSIEIIKNILLVGKIYILEMLLTPLKISSDGERIAEI